AVKYLSQKGHQHFAFFSVLNEAAEKSTTYHHRVDGFRQGICDIGLPPESGAIITSLVSKADLVMSNWNTSRPSPTNLKVTSHEMVKKLLTLNPRPTGLICSNDAMATYVIRALKLEGFS
ncbi:MAG: substrate-binding domain-containing protein, partial [Verrucomicrobiota bacterium]